MMGGGVASFCLLDSIQAFDESDDNDEESFDAYDS
jgi:hypothetical protein